MAPSAWWLIRSAQLYFLSHKRLSLDSCFYHTLHIRCHKKLRANRCQLTIFSRSYYTDLDLIFIPILFNGTCYHFCVNQSIWIYQPLKFCNICVTKICALHISYSFLLYFFIPWTCSMVSTTQHRFTAYAIYEQSISNLNTKRNVIVVTFGPLFFIGILTLPLEQTG